jgi:hypothetical protein
MTVKRDLLLGGMSITFKGLKTKSSGKYLNIGAKK